MVYLFLCGFVFVTQIVKISYAEDPCTEGTECVPFFSCMPHNSSSMLFPCHSGLNFICCERKFISKFNDKDELNITQKIKAFPMKCGIASTDNKITGGQTAEMGQFPWMALLGYRQRFINYTEFLCGGTVITERYVLTAAHCLLRKKELVVVRVGEHNLTTDPDCTEQFGIKNCADRVVDVPVEKFLQHPSFNEVTLKNDIALIRVLKPIQFTEFVQPICLPFQRNLENKNFIDEKFTVSGWGKTKTNNLGGSPTLQYANAVVWNLTKCNEAVPPDVRPLDDTQVCANAKKEDACKGDSGGPLMNSTINKEGDLRYFQIGIVSFASSRTCGVQELPPVYTRVDKFLTWIVNSII